VYRHGAFWRVSEQLQEKERIQNNMESKKISENRSWHFAHMDTKYERCTVMSHSGAYLHWSNLNIKNKNQFESEHNPK